MIMIEGMSFTFTKSFTKYIMSDYIPPLTSAVSHDSVSRDFDYTLITAYLLKGILRDQRQIMILKINDFKFGYRKNYGMLNPHKYLIKKKGNKSKIIPQPWNMDIMRSTIPNVMKIPHIGRNHEVNACVKLLLSLFHGDYLWLYRRITIDLALIHQITRLSMQGPDPQEFYLGKAANRALEKNIKDTYGDVEKGK
jgi:hypothetical protein